MELGLAHGVVRSHDRDIAVLVNRIVLEVGVELDGY